MRRIVLFVLGLVIALAAASSALASSNPIPGVGIVVKRNPGSSTALVIPAGFFGASSSAFSGTVSLEGRSSHLCGGCDNGLSVDSRFDFDLPPGSSVLTATMPSFTLHSTSPIQVSIGGALRALDVTLTLSSRTQALGTSVTGEFTLAQGASLSLGSSVELASGSMAMRAIATFSDASTGAAIGS